MLRCNRRTVVEALAIVVLALALGLGVNYRLVLDALTVGAPPAAPPPTTATTSAYPIPVRLAEVKTLLAAGALAIDARNSELYAGGHLPGARSLPLAAADAALAAGGLFPPRTTLIVYCSGYGCTDSFDLALKLIAAGYGDVRVFEGGWPEWQEAGLPVAGGGQ